MVRADEAGSQQWTAVSSFFGLTNVYNIQRWRHITMETSRSIEMWYIFFHQPSGLNWVFQVKWFLNDNCVNSFSHIRLKLRWMKFDRTKIPPGFKILELPFKANIPQRIRFLDYRTHQKIERVTSHQKPSKAANTHPFIRRHAPGRFLDNMTLDKIIGIGEVRLVRLPKEQQ